MMRIAPRKLIFMALCVLDEAVEQCRRELVMSTIGHRLALAYLYSVSHGRDRRVYDDFWRMIQNTQERAYSPEEGRFLRGT